MQPLPLLLPCEPHSAIIRGQTGCGKTQFVLDELLHTDHGYYRDAFEVVFILCPTWERNHTYLERLWLWRGPHASQFLFIDPRERLHDWLRALFSVAADTPMLYLIATWRRQGHSQKRKTCCPSWHSVGVTRSSRFGCSSKSIMLCARTFVSRPNGWPCSTAKTAFHL